MAGENVTIISPRGMVSVRHIVRRRDIAQDASSVNRGDVIELPDAEGFALQDGGLGEVIDVCIKCNLVSAEIKEVDHAPHLGGQLVGWEDGVLKRHDGNKVQSALIAGFVHEDYAGGVGTIYLVWDGGK